MKQIYEYRPEYELRYIPTDFPPEKFDKLQEFGYIFGSQQACSILSARDFLDYTNRDLPHFMPKRVISSIIPSDGFLTFGNLFGHAPFSSQKESDDFLRIILGERFESLFRSIGPQNYMYLGQDPFHPLMSWSSLKWNQDMHVPVTNSTEKYTIVPLREKTLVSYFKGNRKVPAAKATFVFCSIAPFEQNTNKEPKFEWLRTSWLQPHTWKTPAQDSNDRIRKAFQAVLSKYKK